MSARTKFAKKAIGDNFMSKTLETSRRLARADFKDGRDIDAAQGADGAEIGNEGLTVRGYLYFYNSAGDLIATLYQDGAGNLQFDLADDTKAFTFNDGNVVSGHGTGKDSAFTLHENFTAKAQYFWDASELNTGITNLVSDGNIIFSLNGGGATERVTVYDATAAAAIWRLWRIGRLDGKMLSSAPANPAAGYLGLYPKDDGTWHALQSDGTDTELGAGGGATIDYDQLHAEIA